MNIRIIPRECGVHTHTRNEITKFRSKKEKKKIIIIIIFYYSREFRVLTREYVPKIQESYAIRI